MLDVVIFCEGTYPYVSGGVSSWIQALVTGMPDLTFGLVYLAPSRNFTRDFKFKLPENVKDFLEVYIYDVCQVAQPSAGKKAEAWRSVKSFFQGLLDGHVADFEAIFQHLCPTADRPATLSVKELAFSRQTWDILLEIYQRKSPELSFVDFFWTWRFIHFPLFQLLNAPIPEARVYHTITTGWSGLLATLAKLRYRRPMLLTEHGIYTNERRIEIVQADWIYVESLRRGRQQFDFGTLKSLWINLFNSLGRLCYDHADEIFTLYGGNKVMQVAAGAAPEKIKIIPNGVKIEVFDQVDLSLAVPKPEGEFWIGFVGRVVPIKDVKAFIGACRRVVEQAPHARAYIIGPTEEDPAYFQECQSLVDTLGLGQQVIFTGPQDVKRWYPRLDCMVLTSISEGQPLVILEAYCFGVPCVSTDVGACSELILGGDEEGDKELGEAGFVTRVGAPLETAQAILQLINEPAVAARQRQAGRDRVRKLYAYKEMVSRYLTVYGHYKDLGDSAVGGNRL